MIPSNIEYVHICGEELQFFRKGQLDIADENGNMLPVEELYDDLFIREPR